MKKEIKFNNAKFKILQISDLQDTKETSVDTLNFIESAIESVKPDLIVSTGDQLDVVGLWGKNEKNKNNVRNAIKRLFGIFEKYDIPYVLTFGNHDRETGVPNDEQAKIYNEFKNCICFDDLNDGRPDAATFNLPIKSSDESRTAMNLFIVDSHSSSKGRSYEAVNNKQLDWCVSESMKLKADNGGKTVPSVVFQHIPVPEIYELLKEVPKGTCDALPAFKSRKGKYYILNKNTVTYAGDYGETPSPPDENNGEFETLKDKCGVFAMYFGHDHYNSFIGKVDGVDLGYCPGAGYNTYGLKNRAVRVFEFDESDIKDYKTYTVDYSDVCNKSLTQPVKNFIFSKAPCSPEAAGPFALKCTLIVLAIAAILILVYHFINKSVVITFLIAFAAACVIYTLVSLTYNYILRRKKWKGWSIDNGK
jgi:hypothetical protein